jgi:hypothetical protein
LLEQKLHPIPDPGVVRHAATCRLDGEPMISARAAMLRAVAWAGILAVCVPLARAASPAEEIEVLRARIVEQRARLDAQERQLREQQSRLAEQERLLDDLARRTAGAPTAAAPVAAPPAAAAAAPVPAAVALVAAAAPAATAAAGGAAPVSEREPIRARFEGVRVTLGGSLRTTLTTTTARMQPDATPFIVLPSVPGVREGTTKLDNRLSSLVISVEGARLGDFQLGAGIFAYLFDGDLFSGKYGIYPGMAYVDATDGRWRFAAGLLMDVFSPRIPTMVDSMSAFAGSGNPGNSFKPQLRVERRVPIGSDRLMLQAALADALPSNIQPPTLSSTENTGVPNVEARIAYTSGQPRGDGAWVPWPAWELGLSAASGQFRTFSTGGAFVPYNTRLSGVAIEGALRIGRQFGLQGELYEGSALGPYLGGVFQTVGPTRQAIRSRGGWGEAAWWWTRTLHSHVGYGIDRANAADLLGTGFTSNRTGFVNLFWDPSPMTTLAVELTHRRTVYGSGLDADGYALMLSSELRF